MLSALVLLITRWARFPTLLHVPDRSFVSSRARHDIELAPKEDRCDVKYACTRCDVTLRRRARLAEHAAQVHGLKGRALKLYRKEALALNASGSRRTVTVGRLMNALRTLPPTASPKCIARKVLRLSNVRLIQEESDSSSESSGSSAESDTESGAWSQGGFSAAKRAIAYQERDPGDLPPPPRAPENCRRMPKALIGAIGLRSSYGEDPVVRAFEDAYSVNQQAASATCKQRAGLLFRFLSFARQHFPDRDDLASLCSQEVATAYVDVLRTGGFKSSSLINAIDSCRAAIAQLRISRPLQLAFGYSEARRREIERSVETWSFLKSHAGRQASSDQRKKMLETPMEDWTHLFPVSHCLEFLNLVREAMICAGEHEVLTVPGWQNRRAPGTKPLPLNLSNLQSACGLVGALNGSRLGVLLNFTQEELSNQRPWQGLHVLAIAKHKTSKYHGAARMCLRPHHLRMFQLLAERSAKERPALSKYVFGIAPNSGKASQVAFAAFNKFVAGRLGPDSGQTPFFLNNARKAADTFKYLLSGRGDGDQSARDARAAVTNYLMHTEKTSARYYRSATLGQVVSDFRCLNSLIAIMSMLELIRQNRITFKEVQISRQLSEYFRPGGQLPIRWHRPGGQLPIRGHRPGGQLPIGRIQHTNLAVFFLCYRFSPFERLAVRRRYRSVPLCRRAASGVLSSYCL